MSDLKPCPFCSKQPTFTADRDMTDGYDHSFTISCFECGFNICNEYESEATEHWNRRALTAPQLHQHGGGVEEELRKALATIRDYPSADGRRTEDGYPLEVVYDEFAYRRIVDSYRAAAEAALAHPSQSDVSCSRAREGGTV